MNKNQNEAKKSRKVLAQCRKHGIVVVAGLVVSPEVDNCGYLQSIPRHLQECGLYMPSFVSLESPIPGTPYFERLADEEEPAFLPNALLRDFNGYTLTVRPKQEPLEDFMEAYKWVLDQTYRRKTKFVKFLHDQRQFLSGGWWFSSLISTIQLFSKLRYSDPGRTYMAGTDKEPPEARTVPLKDEDFESEEERQSILEPWRVTDDKGRVLPVWRKPMQVFGPKGILTEEALRLGQAS
jgi:hypothetical protein